MKTEFDCAECQQHIVYEVPEGGGAVGYGEFTGKPGKVCYPCCGKLDREEMVKNGRATLYLSRCDGHVAPLGSPTPTGWKVSNWPGSASFSVGTIKTGRHNIAGKRYDVWFGGPDGKVWHGTQYGDNTQICHCRRVKS